MMRKRFTSSKVNRIIKDKSNLFQLSGTLHTATNILYPSYIEILAMKSTDYQDFRRRIVQLVSEEPE